MTDPQETWMRFAIAALQSPLLPAAVKSSASGTPVEDVIASIADGLHDEFRKRFEPPHRTYKATCTLTGEQPGVSAAVQERSEMPDESEFRGQPDLNPYLALTAEDLPPMPCSYLDEPPLSERPPATLVADEPELEMA